MMGLSTYRIWILFLVFVCKSSLLMGQRISFSIWAQEGITLTLQGQNTGLDFNKKQRIIVPGSEKIEISKVLGEPYVAYQIEAAEGFDLLVEINAPAALLLDPDPDNTGSSIPLNLRLAYNNQGPVSADAGLPAAVEMPPGSLSMVVPVNRRLSGAPGPPPRPLIGGEDSRPKTSMYLYIYGDLGPVPNPLPAGNYTAQIVINISYADYGTN